MTLPPLALHGSYPHSLSTTYTLSSPSSFHPWCVQIFKSDPSETGNATVNTWVGVVIMILAVTMNESAIDSFQNGIAASISTRFLINLNILWIRLAVVLVNVPFIIIALMGLDVLSLFLITNMLTTTCMVPIIMGAYSGPGSDYMSDGMVRFPAFAGNRNLGFYLYVNPTRGSRIMCPAVLISLLSLPHGYLILSSPSHTQRSHHITTHRISLMFLSCTGTILLHPFSHRYVHLRDLECVGPLQRRQVDWRRNCTGLVSPPI